ncbi:hypothetical protein BDZ45DRAFT_119889 [Acephala macrosclerotiorum]|nr:hypothetical protein BDZ45DRAFT_119889 [Acephala macrosclerotiorum]
MRKSESGQIKFFTSTKSWTRVEDWKLGNGATLASFRQGSLEIKVLQYAIHFDIVLIKYDGREIPPHNGFSLSWSRFTMLQVLISKPTSFHDAPWP